MTTNYKTMLGMLALSVLLPATAAAAAVPLVDNRVIIDRSPFYSQGAEDGLGTGNYALNHPSFIDIPYAIFDFGSVSSVGSAILNWNFGSLFGGSGPAEIKLYVGNDADGVISTSDRFMGSAIDTFTYSGGEVRSFDVTALVNAALSSGQYFAARLEATVAPDDLISYYGGQFLVPSLEISPVPEPEAYAMFLVGLGLLGIAARRRK